MGNKRKKPVNRALMLEEVADYLRVPIATIHEEIRSGRLKTFKVGEYIRTTEFDLNDYMNLVATR